MAALCLAGLMPRRVLAASEASDLPARWIAQAYAAGLSFEDHPATVERVRTSHRHHGCGIGAFTETVDLPRRSFAVPGSATVIGTNRCARSLPPLSAAFTSSTSTTLRGRQHQAIIWVRRLRKRRASGKELIAAIIVAYEVNCRIVDALDISTRGWDPPVLSLPAVALAAGKLMKLGPERLTHAVNLAINDHIPMAQTRVQTLSDWKGLADAEAGRNAVLPRCLRAAG
jgi:2-methylcitrate dehydratase